MIRTFIAIDISDKIRQRAADLIERLSESGAAVKWARPETMHLTLKFVGDVADNEIMQVCSVVKDATSGITPFKVHFRGAGAFPNAQRPRIVWAGIQPAVDELQELHKRLEASLADLGYPQERRKFTPHLTLGRLRGNTGLKELALLIETLGKFDLGEIQPSELCVYSSTLERGGPIYNIMSRVPFDRR